MVAPGGGGEIGGAADDSEGREGDGPSEGDGADGAETVGSVDAVDWSDGTASEDVRTGELLATLGETVGAWARRHPTSATQIIQPSDTFAGPPERATFMVLSSRAGRF